MIQTALVCSYLFEFDKAAMKAILNEVILIVKKK